MIAYEIDVIAENEAGRRTATSTDQSARTPMLPLRNRTLPESARSTPSSSVPQVVTNTEDQSPKSATPAGTLFDTNARRPSIFPSARMNDPPPVSFVRLRRIFAASGATAHPAEAGLISAFAV